MSEEVPLGNTINEWWGIVAGIVGGAWLGGRALIGFGRGIGQIMVTIETLTKEINELRKDVDELRRYIRVDARAELSHPISVRRKDFE
jgi:hypothetical protein